MDRTDGILRQWTGILLVGLLVFGSVAGTATAHEGDDHGTLTFHDGEDGEAGSPKATAEDRIELECEFWVRGHNVSQPEGEIRSRHESGAGPHSHRVSVYDGSANDSGGWDLEEGGFTLHQEGDDWQIWAQTGENHTTEVYHVSYEACEQTRSSEERGERRFEDRRVQLPRSEGQAPACPEDLRTEARGNEDVNLTWNASANAKSYHVYRASGDQGFEQVAEVENTSYHDAGTEAETTYRYQVTAANASGEAEDCPIAEVTAIPYFGQQGILALTAVSGIAALVLVRRRG